MAIEKNGTNIQVYEAQRAEFLDNNGNIMSDAAIQEALEEGAKDILINPPSSTVNFDYPKGKKYGWNKKLNQHPLPANTVFRVEGGFKYTTDGSGRVNKIEVANLQRSTPPWDRNQYQQSNKCKGAKNGLPDDQGSHLVASQYGGPGEQINLVPMRKSLNQAGGDWYNMETLWRTKLQNGISITDVKIDIIYGSNGRPTKFIVNWKENGVNAIPIEHLN